MNPEPENANLQLALEERLRFETLIAELSLEFIGIPPGEVDRKIEDAQRRVCEFLGLDLSALWQWSAGTRGTLTLTHLYRPLGGPPASDRMDASEFFPWCLDELQAGKAVVVSSLDDLPPEASRDRETWRHFGIKDVVDDPAVRGRRSAGWRIVLQYRPDRTRLAGHHRPSATCGSSRRRIAIWSRPYGTASSAPISTID